MVGMLNLGFLVTDKVTDRKSTRLNSSHSQISYAVFCLKKKKTPNSHYDFAQAHTPTFIYTLRNHSSRYRIYEVSLITSMLHSSHLTLSRHTTHSYAFRA